MKELTTKILIEYFTGKRNHPFYKKSVEKYEQLKVHVHGEYPKKLVEERRPSEAKHIHEYRKKIYKEITKETTQQIITSLSKIRRSTDWSIKFDAESVPGTVIETEALGYYLEQDFPYYNSLTNWLFSVWLKSYLMDANGIVFTRPLIHKVEGNEYLKPCAEIYHSDRVIEYVENELAVLKLDDKPSKKSTEGNSFIPKRFMVITPVYNEEWEETDPGTYKSIDKHEHKLGVLPCFKMGGVFVESRLPHTLYESRITTVGTRLDEGAREYSDLQAEVVQHVHSEKWMWSTQTCDRCAVDGISIGTVNTGKNKIVCPKCNGTKAVATSPYQNIILTPTNTNLGEHTTPIPPAGYIQKDIAIVEVQDKRVDNHMYRALASVNMQFLMKVPLAESGMAKEVDRDELNNFVYSIAEDAVRNYEQIAAIVNEYRYGVIVPDKNKRDAMLPNVNVPEKFDILSSSFLADEISTAKTANANPMILNALESEYVSKKFYNEPELRDKLNAALRLDPLSNVPESDKMIRLSNNGVTQEDYIISCNINQFLTKAIQGDVDFLQKNYDEQMEKMRAYAQEVVKTTAGVQVEEPKEED